MDLKQKIEEYLADDNITNHYVAIKKTTLWEEILNHTPYIPKNFARWRIWHVMNDTEKNPGCKLCGKDVNFQFDHYAICCSYKCHINLNMDRRAQTNMLRYGGKAPACSKQVQEKMQATTMKNHGVDNISKSVITKAGKVQKAWDRYGVDNVSKAPEVRAKISAYQQGLSDDQVRDIQIKTEKTAKGFRKFDMPDGRKVNIQGYEHWAIDALLENHNSIDIKVGKGHVPMIRYYDENGKYRRHFPDIFLPVHNLIIEVKSTFTYQKELLTNLKKKEAAIAHGFLYQFWVYDHKGRLVIDP